MKEPSKLENLMQEKTLIRARLTSLRLDFRLNDGTWISNMHKDQHAMLSDRFQRIQEEITTMKHDKPAQTSECHFEKCLKEFHDMTGEGYPDQPTVMKAKEFSVRQNLMMEELDEFVTDWYFSKPLSHQTKEITDLLYTVLGTMVKMGLPIQACFDEVHRSNMSKKNLRMNSNGKWIKPPDYSPADMNTVLPSTENQEDENG